MVKYELHYQQTTTVEKKFYYSVFQTVHFNTPVRTEEVPETKMEVFEDVSVIDLHDVIRGTAPEESDVDKRALPGIVPNEFHSRFASGVDCDEVFDNIIIGNV